MAKKGFGIVNLSYRDNTRVEDFLVSRVNNDSSTFNIPLNMNECEYVFPSEQTEIICNNDIDAVENDQYTSVEIQNKIEDMEIEIAQYLKSKTVDYDKINTDIANKTVVSEGNIIFTNVK